MKFSLLPTLNKQVQPSPSEIIYLATSSHTWHFFKWTLDVRKKTMANARQVWRLTDAVVYWLRCLCALTNGFAVKILTWSVRGLSIKYFRVHERQDWVSLLWATMFSRKQIPYCYKLPLWTNSVASEGNPSADLLIIKKLFTKLNL